ncbi:MAG: phosphodiesterase [Rhodobacteraceae bacterium]|nr:phosphodiesterase [Paracoccaceae bacterium]
MPELHADFLTKPLAHRGLHNDSITENSRAAFMAAINAGYGIELDLQLSADGAAMVFHDYNMKRLTGTSGPIQAQTRQQLKSQFLNNGENIPSLQEILDLVKGQVPLLLELKDQDGALGPDIGRLEQRCADLVRGYQGPIALMSFNPHSIYALAKIAPDVARGLVTDQFNKSDWQLVPQNRLTELRDIPDFAKCGAGFISHNHKHLDMPIVAKIKQSGAPVLCWTVKSAKQEIAARKVADNITFEGYLP